MHPLQRMAPYYKAVSGALIALLTVLISGLASDGLNSAEVLTSVVAFLTVGGGVFVIPNVQSNYPPEVK